MAYTRVNWENYPSTNTPRNATNLNVMDAGIDDVDTRLSTVETGWVSANETWTYSSVDDPTGVITISGDVTSKYSLGMRIKFTNNSNVIYGIITAISYSSPNTTLTFLHEIDPTDSLALHLMQNSAITNNFYSTMKVPFGFPINPDKWSIVVTDTTHRDQINPVAGTWYNLGNANISIPRGLWKVNYKIYPYIERLTGTGTAIFVTLSTTNNGQSDSKNTLASYSSTSTRMTQSLLMNDIIMNLDSKTTYYANTMTDSTDIAWLNNNNDQSALVIRAICAYL